MHADLQWPPDSARQSTRSLWKRAGFYPILRSAEIVLDAILYLLLVVANRRRRGETVNRSILLARLDAAGDMVLFAGCLARYRRLYPGWKIVLLVTERTADLAATITDLDEVRVLPVARYRWLPLERLRWRRSLVRERFGIAVSCSYSSSVRHLDALIGWTRAPRRIAMFCPDAIDGRRRNGLYFNELVPVIAAWKHESERNRDLLGYLGDAETSAPAPQVFLTKEDRDTAAALPGMATPGPFVVVTPGAGRPERLWPAENFVRTILAVHEVTPHTWLLCGGREDRALCELIVRRIPEGRGIVLAGRTSLRQLAALIERAQCVVGNESVGVHMAAAVSTPAVCILGGGHYGRLLPWPAPSSVITVSRRLPCYGCSWVCSRSRVECIEDVPVQEVAEALLSVTRKSSAGDGAG
jgi:ADP-heptose:LPS heptosyltransferase